MDPFIVVTIVILIVSVILHEVAHGYMALYLGDHTAEHQGRLTLNPLKHLDPFGSVILPIILALLPGSPIIGWAKPVPYNPYNFTGNRKAGEGLIAAAGPATNMLIALLFGFFLRFFAATLSPTTINVTATIVFINVLLAVFNLMPVPPLDGSKILFSILPSSADGFRRFVEQYQFVFAIIFIFVLWDYVSPLAQIVFRLIVGF